MSADNGSSDSGILDQATQRLRDAYIRDMPPDLVASTVQAIRQRLPPVSLERPAGNPVGRGVLRNGGVAATVLVTLAAAMMLISQGGARIALAQVLDKVKDAESVEFVIGPGRGDDVGRQQKGVFHADKVRVQHPVGIVMIADLKEKKGLYRDDASKTACRFTLEEQFAMEFAIDPITQLRNVKTDDAEHLSNEIVNGQNAEVFRVRGIKLFGTQRDTGEMRVWVDAKSKLPLRIELRFGMSTIMTFKEMRWNSVIDPALLSLKIPDGFSEQPEDSFRQRLHPERESNKALTPTEAFRKQHQ